MSCNANESSLGALRGRALLVSAVLCASCTQSLGTEQGIADKRIGMLNCSSDLEHAQSTTAVELRIVGVLGGPVAAANLTLVSQQFTSGGSGVRVLIGPSLLTEDFLRLDLLRRTGGLLARVEAKLSGHLLGGPVDAPAAPAVPRLAGYVTYNNESHHPDHPLVHRTRNADTPHALTSAFHPLPTFR